MKIILLADVKNYGKKGDIVEASSGYALNYLIPHKLAVIHTDKSSEILAKQKEENQKELERLKQVAIESANKLKDIVIEFSAKAAPDGRMVGTISYKQVEDELKNRFNIEIDKRKFIDKYQINAFGTTKLRIELFKGVVGVVNVHVKEEK